MFLEPWEGTCRPKALHSRTRSPAHPLASPTIQQFLLQKDSSYLSTHQSLAHGLLATRLGYWFVEECRCQSPRLFPRLLPKFLHPSDPIHRAMWLQGPQRMVGNRNELNKCPGCVQRFAFPSGAILLLWGTAYRRRSASAQSIITRDRPLDCTTQFSCNNATVMSG